MRTTILLTLVVQLLGCTSIGSKSALRPDPDGSWKTRYGQYVFSANGLMVSIPEVVLTEHTSAIGPVIPVIPVGNDRSYESQPLEVSLTVTGFPADTELGPESVTVTAHTSGTRINLLSSAGSLVSKTRQNNEEGKLWVQYSLRFSYDIRLGELDQLTLGLELPMFKANIPPLNLSRQKSSDNELVLTPGV